MLEARWIRGPTGKQTDASRVGGRTYLTRYAGLRRQIARANGWHPIKDHATIAARMPWVLDLAKRYKRQRSKMRFRDVEATETGVTVHLPYLGQEWKFR